MPTPTLLALLALATAPVAPADLLGAEASRRQIPFEIVDGRPLVAVTVNGVAGRMMIDNGTPDAVFLDRSTAPIDAGRFLVEGRAASGQAIRVHAHATPPPLVVAGQALALPAPVRSGDFDFTHGTFGDDFMGFIGTPTLQAQAFTLDYARRRMTVLRTDARGGLAGAAPAPDEVLVEIPFALWPGSQPTFAGLVGGRAILVDIDTGSDGMLYLRPATRAALLASGAIREDGERLLITELVLDGHAFRDVAVRGIEAGGPQDARPTGSTDWLMLGSDFLADHPTLWNFRAGTLTVLQPDASVLQPR